MPREISYELYLVNIPKLRTTVGIWIENIELWWHSNYGLVLVWYSNICYCCLENLLPGIKIMVWIKKLVFGNRTEPHDLNTGLVSSSDTQCTLILLMFSFIKFFFNVGPPKEDIFSGHFLSSVFQSSLHITIKNFH